MVRAGSPPPSGIFISYRRTDSAYALLIYKAILERYEPDQVYRDIEDIEPGADFLEALARELARCRVVLAIIGQGWIRARQRLLARGDVVRWELRKALERKILVLPVLVGGAAMPAARALPAPLAPLARRNALVISDLRFDRDVAAVMETLGRHVPAAREARSEAADAGAARTFTDLRLAGLLRRQVHRLQVRAVELVQARDVDRALEELAEGHDLIMELLRRTPSDVRLDAQLGFLYKTMAQALDAAGDPRAQEYLDLAANVFNGLSARAGESRDVALAAEALNGLGNIYHQRRDYEQAIRNYEAAVRLAPDYAYAWHDLFAALLDRANAGGPADVPLMERAVEQVKRTGAGMPGLGAAQIALLERALAQLRLRPAAAGSAKNVAGASGARRPRRARPPRR